MQRGRGLKYVRHRLDMKKRYARNVLQPLAINVLAKTFFIRFSLPLHYIKVEWVVGFGRREKTRQPRRAPAASPPPSAARSSAAAHSALSSPPPTTACLRHKKQREKDFCNHGGYRSVAALFRALAKQRLASYQCNFRSTSPLVGLSVRTLCSRRSSRFPSTRRRAVFCRCTLCSLVAAAA